MEEVCDGDIDCPVGDDEILCGKITLKFLDLILRF